MHEGLVHLVVQRQGGGWVEYVDLVQEGRIVLWRAILGYRPELGYRFSTYAYRAICNRVWEVLGRARDRAVEWGEEREPEMLGEVVQRWQTEQVREALAEEIGCLTERQRKVIEQAYGLKGEAPRSLAAIGRELGVSRERVRQIRNEALVVLRLPALSVRLRSVCERDSREEYRRARQVNNAWLRQRRGLK